MRSHPVSCRVPDTLYKALTKLCHERGYKNVSRCMIANSLIAVQDARRPIWVKEIANAKAKMQDYIIDKMLAFPMTLEEMVKYLKPTDKK